MDNKRRNFLKLIFFGGGTLLLSNLLGKLSSLKSDKPSKDFQNIKIVEEDGKLVFYNKSGKQTFLLSEDGTFEVS